MLRHNGLVDGLHLGKLKLPGQHHYIGPLGIEAEGLHVGNAQLGGNMHFQTNLTAVQDGGHVGGDDGVHPGLPSGIQGVPGLLQILSVQGDIEGHVPLDAGLVTEAHHLGKVFPGKVSGRM